MFDNANVVIEAYVEGLVTKAEARSLLGLTEPEANSAGSLAEAERVLRVISGWNPTRVSTADAIKPAIDYFDA